LVSGLSIFISLLKTIRERKQELALLRTYGLNTGQLLTLALLEGSFLAVIGFVLGWLLGRLGIAGVSGYMESSYGYGLQVSGPDMTELILLVLIFAVAMIASLLASLSIFKLDVAKTLSDA
jgi:putative ABC transport system permease protein